MKFLTTATALLAISGFAGAQSFSSFHNVGSLYGVNVSRSGNTVTFSVTKGAYIKVNGTKYSIEDSFGAWALDANGGFGSSFGGGTQNTNWKYVAKDTGGKNPVGIAGWSDNSKKGTILTPGGSPLSFTFSKADFSKVTSYGFHVSLNCQVSGWDHEDDSSTYFVTGAPAAVPEPVSMATLGVGVLGLLRARRKKA